MPQSLHSYLVEISADAKARELASRSEPYVRGTKTEKRTTARLVPGDRILTTQSTHDPEVIVDVALRKSDAVVRVVDHLEDTAPGRFERMMRITVHFTDGTRSTSVVGHQTWHALVVDRSGSASRQHFIDTGAYLTEAEVAEYAGPPLNERTPGRREL